VLVPCVMLVVAGLFALALAVHLGARRRAA
jgi:hypothetical protein